MSLHQVIINYLLFLIKQKKDVGIIQKELFIIKMEKNFLLFLEIIIVFGIDL